MTTTVKLFKDGSLVGEATFHDFANQMAAAIYPARVDAFTVSGTLTDFKWFDSSYLTESPPPLGRCGGRAKRRRWAKRLWLRCSRGRR